MKKYIIAIIGLVIIFGGGYFVYKNIRGAKPALQKPPQDIADLLSNGNQPSPQPGKNTTQFPLQLPDNFEISVLAKNLSGARVLALDAKGNLWVSRTKEGVITFLDIENGSVVSQHDIFHALSRPHGLAFDPQQPGRLYIAEENKISFADVATASIDKISLPGETNTDFDKIMAAITASSIGFPQKVLDLPKGGRHYTRTLLFDKENNLFVSIGSTCDVCREKNSHHATVMRVNTQEKKLEPFANGLRNAVFLALHPVRNDIWATEMGRDLLGDNLPPDEINILDPKKKETTNYGWPNCYGKNIHDDKFDTNVYIRNPCMEPFETPSYIDLPAHSAPLGLTFIPADSKWPPQYWNNLLVAYHGSWNRSEPTGYKIVRYHLNEKGEYAGVAATTVPQEENFISGWLTEKEQALGRPVDLLATKEGVLYVSDDKAGLVYKVEYKGN